jgi:hypothetical protein
MIRVASYVLGSLVAKGGTELAEAVSVFGACWGRGAHFL